MADPSQTKSEAASPRKREKSREQGQLAISSDFATAMILLAMTQLLVFFTQSVGGQLLDLVGRDLPQSVYQDEISVDHVVGLGWASGYFLIRTASGVLLASVLLAVATYVLQVGFLVAPEALTWKASRLSPTSGMQKIFSVRTTVRSGMAVTKFTCCFAAILATCWVKRSELMFVEASLAAEVAATWRMGLFVASMGALALLVVGAVDLGYQRFQHERDLRMTKQEVKDENKENEGDAQIKARMRKLQRESMKQQRSLKEVKEATVVVTNPTHFAVALRYDKSMDTPIVVAKGTDHLAQRIKRIAAESGVPTLERREVARALYASTEVGQRIPASLFRAVAEIIAHVYALRG